MSKTSVMRALMVRDEGASVVEVQRRGTLPAMRRFLAFSLLVACAPALAADAFLCTDSFPAGDAAGFQGGFGSGEEAAIRIDPDASALPLSVSSVYLFYGA